MNLGLDGKWVGPKIVMAELIGCVNPDTTVSTIGQSIWASLKLTEWSVSKDYDLPAELPQPEIFIGNMSAYISI